MCVRQWQGGQRLRHGHHIVVDQQAVFDKFALLVSNALGRKRAAPEGDPLSELVKGTYRSDWRCTSQGIRIDCKPN
jgi:hypothetical protein